MTGNYELEKRQKGGLLRFTGHPFFDIGAATIAAFNEKPDIYSITEADLKKVADYIEREYQMEPLKSFLGVAFTTNAWFNQPAFNKHPEKRKEYSNRLLRSYHQDIPKSSDRCVFTGRLAIAVAFSDKLPDGRAFRQHIPLLTGENVINFYPWGKVGLPVSGEAILCIQAFPLGCAKCGGRLLAVHSESPNLTYEFAYEFFKMNQKALTLAHLSGSKKMPEAQFSAKTLLIDTLLKIEQRRHDEANQHILFSVTAYHINNSGQSNPLDNRNPPLDIYYLPLELTDFLSHLTSAEYSNEWNAIKQRAWWLSMKKKKNEKRGKENVEEEKLLPQRNLLYEDLLRLPLGAGRFIRRYFLRIPTRTSREEDPRRVYSLKNEAGLVSWKLTELFLRKVMFVNQERIQQIKELGDRLAMYVNNENNRHFFTSFYIEQRSYNNLRNSLIKANVEHVKRGNPPLITLDPYLTIFEDGDEVGKSDWRLARDLVLIRMIEKLYNLGWIGKNSEAIPEILDNEISQD